MLIDNEKYACQACIRGHRVSSCNHSDRELIHVARKGRPISQCQHCRTQRGSRGQHTNCQCAGDKAHTKDDCPHPDGTSNTNDCCCSHSAQCTCAIKKDKSAQVVQEDGSHSNHSSVSPKPFIKNNHDNKPLVFTGHGHHKPAHKFNDAHHQLGSPYQIPSRSRSVNHHNRDLAQRSTDSLPLTKFARPHHESPLHHALTPRQIKSEHNSPMIRPTNIPTSVPNDLSLPAYDVNGYSANTYPYNPFSSELPAMANNHQNLGYYDQYLSTGYAIPTAQAEETQSQPNIDWTAYDFTAFNGDLNGNGLMNDPTFSTNQTLPLPSEEQFRNLNLGMTPSSGDATDVDEFGFSRSDQPRSQSGDISTGMSSPENSQIDRYRLSVDGTPQLQNSTLNSAEPNLDIDDYLRQAQEETKRLSIQNQMRQMAHLQAALSQNNSQENLVSSQQQSQSHTPVNSMHPLSVHEAQGLAHSTGATPVPDFKSGMMMPVSAFADDPSWSAAPDMSNPTLSLDDDQEDEDWVR